MTRGATRIFSSGSRSRQATRADSCSGAHAQVCTDADLGPPIFAQGLVTGGTDRPPPHGSRVQSIAHGSSGLAALLPFVLMATLVVEARAAQVSPDATIASPATNDYAAHILAGISNQGRTKQQPYVTAGDRTYLIGTQDGNFPDMGQHIPGEMGGLWLPPIKLIDGFQARIAEVGPIRKFCFQRVRRWSLIRMATCSGMAGCWTRWPGAAGTFAAYRPRSQDGVAAIGPGGAGLTRIRLPAQRDAPASNRHAIPVELVIFVITTIAGAEVGEIVHELDRRDPLDHLEAQLVLATQPQRRAMQHAERRNSLRRPSLRRVNRRRLANR
jgi:hypothetical protein